MTNKFIHVLFRKHDLDHDVKKKFEVKPGGYDAFRIREI